MLQSWSCDFFSCRNITICWRFLRMEIKTNEQNKIKTSSREHQTFISCGVQSYSGIGSSHYFTPAHIWDTVHTWKSNSRQHSKDHLKETVPSHSLVGERRKEVFWGAWVKSRQCDCISVHENSAPHMPLPPHSPCPHCIPIPTSPQSTQWIGMRGHFCLLKNKA